MRKILLKNGIIITLNKRNDILKGDLLLEGERIKKVGGEIKEKADRIIKAEGKIIMPGFVQSHVHLCQSLFRGQADDMPLLNWLDRITELESRHTAETLYISSKLGIAEMIKAGTTSIIDMGTLHNQESIFQAMKETGIRGQSGKAMMDLEESVPEFLRETTEESIKKSLDLADKWSGAAEGRITYGFAPRWQLWVTNELLQDIKKEADRKGLAIHGHAGEIKDEVPLMIKERGTRNLIFLEKLGVVGPNVQMAHCIWLDERELKVLEETGTHVLHCPCCNLKLGSGIAPIPEMLSRGINVALGSDGAPSNNNLDPFMEMRVASLIQQYRKGPGNLKAEEVLRMATLGGAKALGLEEKIGTLEPQKLADIIILNPQSLNVAPLSSLAEIIPRIISAFQSFCVETSIINGEVVMENRILKDLNESDLLNQSQKAISEVFKE